jgi:hypothetical protein
VYISRAIHRRIALFGNRTPLAPAIAHLPLQARLKKMTQATRANIAVSAP